MANTTALDWEKVAPAMNKQLTAIEGIRDCLNRAVKIASEASTEGGGDAVVASVAEKMSIIYEKTKDLPEACENLANILRIKSTDINESNEDAVRGIENL